MNNLLNITKKELKELLTPGSVLSVVLMVFIFMGIGTLMGGAVEEASSLSTIGIVNGEADSADNYWSEFAIDKLYEAYGLTPGEETALIVMLESPYGDTQKITEEMIEKGVTMAIGIVPGFTASIKSQQQTAIEEYYIFYNSGLLGTAGTSISAIVVGMISNDISLELVSNVTGPADADFLLHPVSTSASHSYTYINGEVYDDITPLEISLSIMSQTMMVPIVIMMIIIVIGSMVISSMGSEKENKTLETLLTMPVTRTTIVSGKLLSAAIVGLIYGLLYMIGMSFYVGGMMGIGSDVDLSEYGLALGLIDWVLIAAMIFFAIFCALGICMILGAFTKNFKASQTMILPITVLAMIPMFVTMFTSWATLPLVGKVVLFAIPFSHPMMVMNNLMFGDLTLVFAGLAYLVVFTLVMIFITVKLYKSDILLTGLGNTKAGMRMNKLVSKRKKA